MQKGYIHNAELITTGDGSPTLFLPDLEESYHSRHGALAESLHVFINNGLLYWLNENPNAKEVRVLEIGFGTGLNAFLTYKKSDKLTLPIHFTSLEAYPLPTKLLMEYGSALGLDEKDLQSWEKLHKNTNSGSVTLSDRFRLEVIEVKLQDFKPINGFDIIYFDAFAPQRQPDMWELVIMEKCYQLLNPKGLWVSYCAKGQLKRDLKSCGFKVNALPGAPGKKEMTIALKIEE